ncbi:MAG: extracellular solute-binding protein [Anaerolineae bacterium]|nr:extracellular solute-binding protein [Anaerolineae bacterium]
MPRRISRRRFLQTTAAAAGGLALSSAFPLSRRARGQGVIKLTQVTSSDQVPYFEFINAEFQKLHPEVEFDLIGPGYDQMRTKIISSLVAGAPMDIFSLDIIWVGEFASQGFCEPMDQSMTDAERAEFLPGALEGITANGALQGLPAGAWMKNLFYNKGIVEQLGLDAPPTTYEQLAEVGKQAQADGVLPYIFGWGWTQNEGFTCDWTVILHAFGGKWFDDEGKWAINNENGVAALTYMVDNLKAEVFDPASITYDDRQVMNPFLAGQYLGMCNWGLWGWSMSNSPDDSKIVGQADVGLMFGTEYAGTTSSSILAIPAISLNAASPSENKDLATEWMRLYAGIGHPEYRKAAMDLSGIPPVQTALWSDPDLMADVPVLPKLADQATYGYQRPSSNVVNYSEWSTMLQTELSKALTGQVTPQEALDAIVETSNVQFPNISAE